METVAYLIGSVKDLFKNWSSLDADESATWFLLTFVYANGLTADDDLCFKMAGKIPQLTAPHLSLVMAILCLVISVVVLMEPLLCNKIRGKVKGFRSSLAGRLIRIVSVFIAYTMGMASGFNLLIDRAPALSWLIVLVAYVGFIILLVLGITSVVAAVRVIWQRTVLAMNQS